MAKDKILSADGAELQAAPEPAGKLTHEAAFAKAIAAFSKAEAAIVEALADADDGVHEELASVRGALTTALGILRSGKPQGA